MQNGGNHSPMAQEAVLLNTADAWTSNNTETNTDDEPVPGSHWDKAYGWGYLNMSEAFFNLGDYFIDTVIPRNSTATPDDYHLYRGVMYANEKATLSTTTAMGSPIIQTTPAASISTRSSRTLSARTESTTTPTRTA